MKRNEVLAVIGFLPANSLRFEGSEKRENVEHAANAEATPPHRPGWLNDAAAKLLYLSMTGGYFFY